MTNQEAIDKMEYCKRAYQMLIDENSQEGILVGKGCEAQWKADTPLYKVYEDMRDACDMSIKALEQEPSGDLISRQATLEPYKVLNDTDTLCVALIRANIMQQPSVNPKEPLEVEATELQKAYNKGFEDCRQAVMHCIDAYSSMIIRPLELKDYIDKLPPVNPQEPKYCDRNICVSNEYNGIGCNECEVMAESEE